MKFCYKCIKEIDDEAKFCPSCGEPLDRKEKAPEQPKGKWYFNNSSLIVSFLCVGPFMLPLVWFNPKFSAAKKILYTVAIAVMSYLIFVVFLKSMKTMLDSYKMMASF